MKISYLILIIILVLVIGIVGFESMTGKVIEKQNKEIKEFTIKAFRFGYEPAFITINKGEKVRINIDNTDTLHGIRIPELNVKGNEAVEFIANKTGKFTWYCTNGCGSGHMQMQGKLIVK